MVPAGKGFPNSITFMDLSRVTNLNWVQLAGPHLCCFTGNAVCIIYDEEIKQTFWFIESNHLLFIDSALSLLHRCTNYSQSGGFGKPFCRAATDTQRHTLLTEINETGRDCTCRCLIHWLKGKRLFGLANKKEIFAVWMNIQTFQWKFKSLKFNLDFSIFFRSLHAPQPFNARICYHHIATVMIVVVCPSSTLLDKTNTWWLNSGHSVKWSLLIRLGHIVEERGNLDLDQMDQVVIVEETWSHCWGERQLGPGPDGSWQLVHRSPPLITISPHTPAPHRCHHTIWSLLASDHCRRVWAGVWGVWYGWAGVWGVWCV